MWIAGKTGNLVEISDLTGARIRLVHGARLGCQMPDAVTADGPHVWIACKGGAGSILELSNSSGKELRVLRGVKFHLDQRIGIAVNGVRVWILNSVGEQVAPLAAVSARTGRPIQVRREASCNFHNATALLVSRADRS